MVTLVGSQGQLPPGEVLAAASIDAAPVSVLDSRIPNWRVKVADQPGVLKRDWHLDEADIAWEHTFLSRLATSGFPAPRPIPGFAGRSWLRLAGALWTLVRFQPGHVLGWEARPGLGEVGRFIAHYHEAVDGLEMDAPGRWCR